MDIEKLIKQPESSILDFKKDVYDLSSGTNQKFGFLKDVISFSNTIRLESSYIIFGVQELEMGKKNIVGISRSLDDATLQNIVADKLFPLPKFLYHEEQYEDKPIGILEFSLFRYACPITSKYDLKGIKKNQVYYRAGSRNTEADIPTIMKINDWMKALPSGISDSSKKANHSPRNRINEFNEFLCKRNLENTDSSNFGQNDCSKTLFSRVSELDGQEKPLVLFSLIPKYPNKEEIKMPLKILLEWLETNASGYEPSTSVPLYFYTYNYNPKMDGLILNFIKNQETLSYFEILNNGFVESGFSHTIIDYYGSKENVDKTSISLTLIVGYEMLLLSWAKKFYSFIEYYDEILLQLSFVNVGNRKLSLFNSEHKELPSYKASNISNIYHNNFKLNYRFKANDLTTDKILATAKIHSEKICRAFGLEKDYAFVDDKLSTSELNYLFK